MVTLSKYLALLLSFVFAGLAVVNWFSLAGSTVTVGQRTWSGKYVSDNVSVSGMVPLSNAFTYMAYTFVNI